MAVAEAEVEVAVAGSVAELLLLLQVLQGSYVALKQMQIGAVSQPVPGYVNDINPPHADGLNPSSLEANICSKRNQCKH